jgi:hypothetical protein
MSVFVSRLLDPLIRIEFDRREENNLLAKNSPHHKTID